MSARSTSGPYAFKYTGFINIPSDGVYVFYAPQEWVRSDVLAGYDLRLYIDGEEWYPSTTRNDLGTWSVALEQGKHQFEVKYIDYRLDTPARFNKPNMKQDLVWGGTTPNLMIAGPGISKQEIPNEMLEISDENYINASTAVGKAVITKLRNDVNAAQILISKLSDGSTKNELQNKIDSIPELFTVKFYNKINGNNSEITSLKTGEILVSLQVENMQAIQKPIKLLMALYRTVDNKSELMFITNSLSKNILQGIPEELNISLIVPAIDTNMYKIKVFAFSDMNQIKPYKNQILLDSNGIW